VVHDRAQTTRADVKKIFNCNFGNTPVVTNGVLTATVGTSTLFMKSLEPGSPAPTITPITGQPLAKSNYQEMLTGQTNNNFFHIFEAGPSTQTAITQNAFLDAGLCEGVEMKLPDSSWVGMFAKTDSMVTSQISYSFHCTGPQRHIVSDLAPNVQYSVKAVSKGQTIFNDSTKTTSASGVASFSFSANDSGIVTLVPGKVPVVNMAPAHSPDRGMAIWVTGRTLTMLLDVDAETDLSAHLFDCTGKIVLTIVNSGLAVGRHRIQSPIPENLASGGYVVVYRANRQQHAFKFVLGR
jgi:hypothetical protein